MTARRHDRPKPDDVFEQLIWQNPEVCSNCFSRCKWVAEGVYRDDNTGDRHPVYADGRTEDASLGYDVRERDAHGALRTHEPRTTCENCGSVRLLADDDTLSIEAAVGRVDALAARLDEAGYAFDAENAKRLVRLLKRTESMTNFDWEIFAGACQHFAEPAPTEADTTTTETTQ